jgi:uncharacterized membrane protein YphA (DoxX/SURF4 family)
MSLGSSSATEVKGNKAKTVALWLATGLLAALFLLAGSMKFVKAEEAGQQFAQFGYPDWFRVLIGLVEVGGGLALLVPRTAFYAASALGVVMVGAVFTVLRGGEGPQAAVPFVVLLLLALVAYARRPGPAR